MNNLEYELRKCKECSCSRCNLNGTTGCYIDIAINLDTNFMMPTDMEEFKQMATAPSVVNPDVMREGIVLRDPTNDFSFKNVSREYLLKHNG